MPVRIISPEEVRRTPGVVRVCFIDTLVRLNLLGQEQKQSVMSVQRQNLSAVLLNPGTTMVVFPKGADLVPEVKDLEATNFSDRTIYVTRLP